METYVIRVWLPDRPGALPEQTYVNIAAYKFVSLDNLEAMRPQYQALCNELGLKGTVLLTPEGINMFVSGPREQIDQYLAWVRSDARLADLEWKESVSTWAATQPRARASPSAICISCFPRRRPRECSATQRTSIRRCL